ncbi:MAG: head-tail connector protein [Pseudomonadota bacterium]
MVAILVDPPQAEPVTRDEAKAHARVDGDAEDQRIDALISAARAEVENRTRRALMRQSWRIVCDGIPSGGIIRLTPAPVMSVDAVTLYAGDGTPEVLSADDYQVDLYGQPGRLKFLSGHPWGVRAMNGVEVDFTCGAESAEDVPAPLKQAILMLVAEWFEHREAGRLRAVVGPVESGISALLAPYRLPRLQ